MKIKILQIIRGKDSLIPTIKCLSCPLSTKFEVVVYSLEQAKDKENIKFALQNGVTAICLAYNYGVGEFGGSSLALHIRASVQEWLSNKEIPKLVPIFLLTETHVEKKM